MADESTLNYGGIIVILPTIASEHGIIMTFQEFKDLLVHDRSVRRFDETRVIDEDTLSHLVELTRFCASGRNLQPLRYRPVTSPAERDALFPLLAWAGYLPDWDGPEPGERPSAYLVQCLDTRLTTNPLCDNGLQLQAITLGATALGIGCCIIKSFNMEKTRELLNLPPWARIEYILALGFPREAVTIEEFDGDVRYYRTPDGVHHVPKRPLSDIVLLNSAEER